MEKIYAILFTWANGTVLLKVVLVKIFFLVVLVLEGDFITFLTIDKQIYKQIRYHGYDYIL